MLGARRVARTLLYIQQQKLRRLEEWVWHREVPHHVPIGTKHRSLNHSERSVNIIKFMFILVSNHRVYMAPDGYATMKSRNPYCFEDAFH